MKTAAAAIVLTFAVTGPVMADLSQWHGLATPDYSQCFVRTQCCLDPLGTDHELVFDGICSVHCGDTCRAEAAAFHGDTLTQIRALTTHEIASGDFGAGSEAWVKFHPTDPDTLSLQYYQAFDPGQGPPLQPPLPSAEVLVFRYAGDPAVFDALGPLNRVALVVQGIIENDDVLFADNLTEDGSFATAEVDVSGIPPSEIVVMISGRGVVPSQCPPGADVPAGGGWTSALLLAAMLGAAAVLLPRGMPR